MIVGVQRTISPNILKAARIARRAGLKWNNGNPEGACRWSSIRLISLLKKGILVDGEFYTNLQHGIKYPHSWVEYNGLIIDVTADQFNKYINDNMRMRAIVVAKPEDLWDRYEKICEDDYD